MLPDVFDQGWSVVSGREAGANGVRIPCDGEVSTIDLIRLPTLHSSQIIRALKRAGFVQLYQRGSHLTLEHPIDGRWTVVPVHGRDIKRGLMKAILEQAGLTQAEFREFL